MSTLYTYSGKVSFPGGAPSVMDIAIQLMREGRYAGAGLRWYPVGLHSFVVADLLPKPLKFHGLMHDSDETITGDIPSPVKTDEQRELAEELRRAIYLSINVPFPTAEEDVLIKAADTAALCGEVYAGAGTVSLQECNPRHPQAEARTLQYMNTYSYADMLDASGRAPIEFLRRFRVYKGLLLTI
jgi:hypothetical protein